MNLVEVPTSSEILRRDQLVPCETRLARTNRCRFCESPFFTCFKNNNLIDSCDCDQPIHEQCLMELIITTSRTADCSISPVNQSLQPEMALQSPGNQTKLIIVPNYQAYTCPKCKGTAAFRLNFQIESIPFNELTCVTKFVVIMLGITLVTLFAASLTCINFAIFDRYYFLFSLVVVFVALKFVVMYNCLKSFRTRFYRPRGEVNR